MVSMFKAINDLIIKYTSYPDESIFKNYYNNVTLPKVNHYCVITELHSTPLTALVYTKWTPDEVNKTSEGKANQLMDTFFQVDFYGEESRQAAFQLAACLQSSFGTTFLKEFGYTVRRSESPKQISNPFDRDNYVLRYAVRFSLFNNVIVSETIESFDKAVITPILIEVQKR